MACKMIDDRLVAFQMAALDDAARTEVETHLLGCRICLESFFAVKQACDAAAVSRERPAPAVHASLRAAFLKGATKPGRLLVFGLKTARRRPAQALAAGLAAAALLALGLWLPARHHQKHDKTPPAAELDRAVDSASPTAQNLNTL